MPTALTPMSTRSLAERGLVNRTASGARAAHAAQPRSDGA